MKIRLGRALCVAAPLVLSIAGAAHANQPATNSLPQPIAVLDTIAPARDVPYPGTIGLTVDATDTARAIFRVKETIPVAASGPMTLLYPKWLPGNHSPTGPIAALAGLVITANGKTVPWVRDTVDVYAFHLSVPEGARTIEVAFQYLSPTAGNQGRIMMTPDLLSLQWEKVALYPAGYFVRDIPFAASVTYPKGWKSASALIPGLSGDTVTYPEIDFETLVDSPAIAGRNMRSDLLAPGIRLDIGADRPDQLVATPDQIAAHKRLIEQAVKLFGAQHYDHYDFLLTLSDSLGGEGLEHHRSSEDGTVATYFTEWDKNAGARNLLPHEFTHSWDGKFRRAADLWTPDYRTPMQDSLLWVYEGQTQYWGYVLQARSGLVGKDDTLAALAMTAALYDNRDGRIWRPVLDTTNDPIIAQRRPKGWTSWQRSEDYYSEGQLVWLDADQLIREKTKGAKSLDDFARAFFGIRDRDWGVVTYRFDDVVAGLNGVMPYDWAGFLHARIDETSDHAPLDWIARGGYRLVYSDTPTPFWKSNETARKMKDFSYSIGLTLGDDAAISGVAWGSPAFDAKITVGGTVLAVNGAAYTDAALKAAITDAKGSKALIHLLIKQGNAYRDIAVIWIGGLRYPRLEKTGTAPSGLDALLAPKR